LFYTRIGIIPANLPSKLQVLSIHSNKITGEVPHVLPASLTKLYCHQNLLEKLVPSSIPPGMLQFYCSSNTVPVTLEEQRRAQALAPQCKFRF
jgi:hypothetical protein